MAAVLAAASTGLTEVAAQAPAAAAMPSTITIDGHGDGHGRGMGQYGAYGYATQGWSFPQILSHYYGGTTPAQTSVPSMQVSLSELYGASTVTVQAPAGSTLLLDGVNTGKTSYTMGRNHSIRSSNGADIIVSGPWSNGSTRQFKGYIAMPPNVGDVINLVPLNDYVAGVVPRESPASWPAAALAAQAVAARTYALAYTSNGSGYICDNTYCQMYGGDPAQYPNSYSAQSNAAVASTGNEVLVCAANNACGSQGQLAYTEYSASTGGYTAGGRFPAVVDSGDNAQTDPYYSSWSVQVATSTIQADWPQLGTLQSINVTSRNGLGDFGGRVLQMNLVGSSSTVTLTGAQFAGMLGLDSNWFAIANATPPPGSDTGYWVAASDGSVYPFGSAQNYGSMAGKALNSPVVGMAPTYDYKGYWLVGRDGGIFNFGDAPFKGSAGAVKLNAPVVAMAGTSTSQGYWLVASDGGIFTYGNAGFYGSTGNVHLVQPVVGMAPTHDGKGYWLVAADGGVFTFGDAPFYGSTGNVHLDAPVVGIVPTSDGKGYWLVAADGGIFNFGDAAFRGSSGGTGQTGFVSVTPTPDGGGYLLVNQAGSVYTFGDATYLGDPADSVPGWSGSAVGVYDA
jgi:SpoIID/LytB domain protein